MQKIGILGSGAVAKTLGVGFLKHGYAVMLGTGTPGKLDEWQAAHAVAAVGSFGEAASFGEIIVLAVKGHAAEKVLQSAGQLNGKIIIDATNPIDESRPPA